MLVVLLLLVLVKVNLPSLTAWEAYRATDELQLANFELTLCKFHLEVHNL